MRRTTILIGIVLLLSFASIAAAQGPPIECFSGNLYNRDAMIAMAILVMVMLVALAYMLSKLMHRQEWEAWAKTESYQLVLSCMLALSMIILADTACFASFEIARGNPFDISNRFLDSNYRSAVLMIYEMFILKTSLEYMAGFQILAATNPLILMPAFPGVSAVAQTVNTVIWIVSILAANITVQKIIFEIIQRFAFSVVLPVGLILRVFPVTRDAGSFLIAVAFGFYIVLPLTYVMAYEVMAWLPPEELPTFYGIWGFPIIGPPSFFIFNLLVGPMELFFWSIKDLNLVLAATFFPALNMTITVTFIKSLSKAIIHHTG
jgi:hypothetical protein